MQHLIGIGPASEPRQREQVVLVVGDRAYCLEFGDRPPKFTSGKKLEWQCTDRPPGCELLGAAAANGG